MLRNTFSEEEINGDEAQDRGAGGYGALKILTPTILSSDRLTVTKMSSEL